MLNITYKDRRTCNIWVRVSAQLSINRLKDDRLTLVVIRPDKATWETSQAVERQPGQILEAHNLAEDSLSANLRRHAEVFAHATVAKVSCEVHLVFFHPPLPPSPTCMHAAKYARKHEQTRGMSQSLRDSLVG